MCSRPLLFVSALGLVAACGSPSQPQTPAKSAVAAPTESPTLDHTIVNIDGEEQSMADYRGKVALVVNTASECGFTPQYEGLEQLHKKYNERGLVVLGFPSNDFGGQEPGSEAEIKTFCQQKFQVSFPMFAKVHARGPEVHPLYKTLSEQTPEGVRGAVKWNFTKFLVDREGKVIARFEPNVKPLDDELTKAVEAAL
ncbi:MAG: glutathione peroxidase [Nannocystaceae bacterium]